MYKYEIIMYYSDDDEAFIVSVPELPGCMADGKTPVEAVTNAQQIMSEWIECAKEDGWPIPKPRGELRIKIEEDLSL